MWFGSKIIADADAIKTHLAKRHRRKKGIIVIPYGAKIVVDVPDSAPIVKFGLASAEYYLLVCRLEPENHVREIVEGYLASETKFPLLVIGDIDATTDYAIQLRNVMD